MPNIEIKLFSPGVAMALAAAVSVYSAAFAELSNCFRCLFLIIGFVFVLSTIGIEWMHTKNQYKIEQLKQKKEEEKN